MAKLPGGKMPRRLNQAPQSEAAQNQDPNGAVRPLAEPAGKMPKRQGGKPLTSTPLEQPVGKMPRNVPATTPRDPVLR